MFNIIDLQNTKLYRYFKEIRRSQKMTNISQKNVTAY